MTKKKFSGVSIKFYIDSGKNSGLSLLLLNEDIDYLVSFPQSIEMIDKDYKGSFYIPDLYEFDDIYKVQIIVDTERINPFRLNHFKRLD